MYRVSYKNIKIDSGVEVKSNKIENTLTLQINNGTIENTNKYTFDGSSAKTLDIIPGTNVTLTTTANTLTIDSTDTHYTAGTGLTASGTTFNHSNSITANTTGIGSATAVPVIKYDSTGHITSATTSAVQTPNSLVMKVNSGTTEGTDLYTFDGSTAKSLNIIAGNNVTLTADAGTLTINSSGATSTAYTAGTGLTLTSTEFSLSASGATSGTYGTNSTTTLTSGGTFIVPTYTVDTYGRITSGSNTTLTLPSYTVSTTEPTADSMTEGQIVYVVES